MKRIVLFGLLSGVLAVGTGCGLLQSVFCYRPCLTRGDCNGGPCTDGCEDGCGGPSCGPVRRVAPARCAPRVARAACVADCDMGCDTGCGRPYGRPCGRATCASCNPGGDPCGDPCTGRCWNRGPLTWVFALIGRGIWGCGGCGERYWGDFYGDPPDCWDPCDGYGNYTGGAGSGCRSCGRGYSGEAGYAEGYPAGGRAVVDQAMPIPRDGKIVSENDRVVEPAAKPVAQPRKAIGP